MATAQIVQISTQKRTSEAPGPARVIVFEQLGKGEIDRDGLAGWLRARKL